MLGTGFFSNLAVIYCLYVSFYWETAKRKKRGGGSNRQTSRRNEMNINVLLKVP